MEALVCCLIGGLTALGVAVLPGHEAISSPVATPPRARDLVARAGAAVSRALVGLDRGLGDRIAASSHRALSGLRLEGSDPVASLGVAALLVCAAAAFGAVAFASPIGLVVGGCSMAAALGARSARVEGERSTRLVQALPEAFGSLAVALAAGRSLPGAMRYVGSRMEEPIRGEFTKAGYAIEFGAPAADALDAMLSRLASPGLGMVAIALKVSKRTGAPPGGLLSEAARYAADRVSLARELDVKTAQARMSARVVALMPLVMAAFLMAFSTDYRRGVATAAGAASLLGAVALDAFAWAVIGKIMRIDL